MSDGQSRYEQLITKNKGTDNEERIVNGYYSFKNFGKKYYVNYTADKNGYQAKVSVSPIFQMKFSVNLARSLIG